MAVICSTFGYPYALDIQNKVINIRGIKGHILGTGKQCFPEPVFQSYELNFLAPRGLSGAPLLTSTPGIKVCGMIVANRSQEMEVARSREVIEGDNKTETFTRFEAMHTGIAIQSGELMNLSFKMLGGSIERHLVRNGLLGID